MGLGLRVRIVSCVSLKCLRLVRTGAFVVRCVGSFRGVVLFTGLWNSSVSEFCFFFCGLEFVTVGKSSFGVGLMRINRSCVGLIISRDH